LLIICAFLLAIILCGAVSASTTVTFSSDGKNLTIIPSNVKSTLKTTETSVIKNGIYGYGTYDTLKITGLNNRGIYNNMIIVSFNNAIKTLNMQLTEGSVYVKGNVIYGTNQVVMKLTGSSGHNITMSGISTIPIHNINGQKLFTNGVTTVNYYLNGIIFAKTSTKSVDAYKSFYGKYISVKKTETTNTVYSNGFTRTAVIYKVYNRNSLGVLTGMKVTGTSKGTEIINNKTVTYNGKIYISTRYDPKDLMDEKYTTGAYKEVKTSSSRVLLKLTPLEPY
jgi:hypothetical protein